MTFRKHVMISAVLLCVSGLLLGCSEENPVTLTAGDEAPPTAVSGLSAMLISGGGVALSWDASSSPNLRGYKVYRHNVTEQAIGLLTASPVTDNHYNDMSVVLGPKYEYMVTAVNARGLESVYATVEIGTMPRKDRGRGLDN